MPNHVEQDLTISGPVDDLRAFQNAARDGDKLLSANKFVPYPANLALLDAAANKERKDKPEGPWKLKDGFNQGGYEWCIENWGTKWGIYDAKLTHDIEADGEGAWGPLEYKFESAWSPAIKVIEAMSRRFPSLHFDLHWYEKGMAVQGHYQVQSGKALVESDAKYYGTRGG